MRPLAFRSSQLLLFLAAWGMNCMAATYFVAPSGSDTNAGTTLEAPFRTLQQAATILVAGDACFIRAGLYRETLAPTHSGTSQAPIVFQAWSNEVVRISGADVVTGWKYWSKQSYAASAGWDLGNGYNQVFVDGRMVHQARFPNFGARGLLHPATVAVTIDATQPEVVGSPAFGGRADNFWAGGWFSGGLGVCWSWQTARIIASSGNTITLEPATQSRPWFTGSGVGVVWGLLSLLNAENEWHLQNRPAGIYLYLCLPGGANPGAHTVELKRRNWCVDLNGVDYVTIRGLRFQAGAVRMQGTGNVLENCTGHFLSHFLKYSWGYAFDGGHAQGGGVVLSGVSNVVRGCTLGDTAGSGIVSSGSRNLITRNLIYDTDYSGTYACAIRLNGSEDQVTFNTARYSGRDIVQPAGSGHSLFYNDLHHAGQMCRDLGVIYVWGVDAASNHRAATRIAYNWIHDHALAGPGPLVYLDNWSRNFVVDHNVCWNAPGDTGIRVNGPAYGHQLYNNTLFNCDGLGTYTYDMWPDHNPDPAFWTSDTYEYLALNNLFLGNSPKTQLVDWVRKDFRLRPKAAAMDAGVVIPGFTDPAWGGRGPDKGAYESGGVVWKAGVDGWRQFALSFRRSAPGKVTVAAVPAAAQFRLYSSTNTSPNAVWTPVTNLPVVTSTQWSTTLPVSATGMRFFRLQSN